MGSRWRAAGLLGLVVLFAVPVLADENPLDDEDLQQQRTEYFYRRRMLPDGTIPVAARERGIRQANALPTSRLQLLPASGGSKLKGILPSQPLTLPWNFSGPRPINESSPAVYGHGPMSLRINGIAVHPTNPNTLYLATSFGGVAKSTDGGNSFTFLTDGLPSQEISSIAIDTASPNILYAGTGDAYNNYFSNAQALLGVGIYRSTDSGATWGVYGGSTFAGTTIRKIVLDPSTMGSQTSTTLYAAVGDTQNAGFYRSADSGQTWTYYSVGFLTDTAYDIALDSTTQGTIYFCSRTGVWKTTNFGSTFTNIHNNPNSDKCRLAMAGSTLYLSNSTGTFNSATFGNGTHGSVFTTSNGGASWTELTAAQGFCGGQCWYDQYIAINPAHSNQIFLGGVDASSSSNAGASFVDYAPFNPPAMKLHSDHHAIAFAPSNPSIVYEGNDGGIYKSADGGNTWSNINSGLGGGLIEGLSVSGDGHMAAGFQDNGTAALSVTTGTAFTQIFGGDGGFAKIDPNNSQKIYGSYVIGNLVAAGLLKLSVNGGASYSDITPASAINTEGGLFYPPLYLNPSNTAELVAGFQNIWRTQNSGASWTKIGLLNPGGYYVSAVAEAPSTSSVIYAGITNYSANAVYVTTTAAGAGTWTLSNSGLPTGQTPTAIAVHPADPNTAYVTYSQYGSPGSPLQHVYKTTNGGASWVSVSSGLPDVPFNCILIDTAAPSNLFAASDVGVFNSIDAGATWTQSNLGLPNGLIANWLSMHGGTRQLVIGTYGRGAYTLTLPNAPPPPANIVTAAVYPASVTYTWSAVPSTYNVQTYGLYPSSAASTLVGSVPSTSFTWNGLAPNTTAALQVTAANGVLESANSPTASTMTLAVPPGPPFGVNPYTAVSSAALTVNWASGAFATAFNPPGTLYTVTLSTSASLAPALSTQQNAGFSATFTGLSPASTYYAGVIALNGLNVPTPAFALGAAVTSPAGVGSAPSVPPANLSPVPAGPSSMTWTWGLVSGATAYYFYPSTGGPFTAVTTNTYTQTGLSLNTAYGAFVAGANSVGQGPLSPTVTGYTLAAPPAALSASGFSQTSINLSWSANGNGGGTQYMVEAATGAFGPLDVSSQTLALTSVTVSGLAAGTLYNFRVRSLNALGLANPLAAAISTATVAASSLPVVSPDPLYGSAQGVSSITWNWNSVPNATSYNFYPSTGGSPISVPGTSFTQTNLSTGTPYGASVAGAAGASVGPLSSVSTAYTLAAPPGNPSLSAQSATSLLFTWTANTNPGGTQYLVMLATSASAFATPVSSNTVAATSTTFTGLSAATTYFARAGAFNGNFDLNFGPTVSAITSTGAVPSGAPTLSAAALGVSSVSWSWTSVTGATLGYDFYPSTGGAPILFSSNTFSWIQTGLPINSQTGATVAGAASGGTGPLSNAVNLYTLAAPPASLALLSRTGTSATLSWSQNGNPAGTGFFVEASTTNLFTVDTASVTIASGTTGLGGLAPATTYFFRARALNGNAVFSPASNVVSTITLPGAPGTLNAAALGVSSIAWSWGAAPGATGYNFYPSTGGPPVSVAGTSFNQTSLAINTNYTAQVTALVGGGESPPTSPASAFTLAAPPTGLLVLARNGVSATVGWSANGNPPGTGFLVEAATSSAFSLDIASAVVTATSTLLGGLASSTSYFFQARAVNGAGLLSPASNSVSTTTLGPPPSTPTGLAGTTLGVSSVSWSWSPAGGASSYNFYPSTGGPPIGVAATSLVQTGLSTNTVYGARVSALGASESALSAPVNAATLAAVPTGFALTGVGVSTATLLWAANTNPSSTTYLVEASTFANFSLDAASAVAPSPPPFVLTGLSGGTSYFLRVSAINGLGALSPPTPTLSTITLPTTPLLAGNGVGVSSITWSWSAVTGATGYNFYPSTGGAPISSTNTFLTQVSLSTNAPYAARISAKDATGEGALSATVTGFTLAAIPTSFAFTGVAASSISVSWSTNTNPAGTGYLVEASTAANFSLDASSALVTANSAVLPGLTPGTSYFVQVRSQNGAGAFSPAPPALSTTTLAAPPGSPPAQVNAAVLGLSSIAWSWSAVSGATSYNFYPSTGGAPIALATTGFTQVGLSTNTAYGAQVTAATNGGESARSGTAVATTLAAPATGFAVQVFVSSASLTWAANTNAPGTQYLLEVATAAGFGVDVTSATVATLGAPVLGLSPASLYFFRVAAINGSGLLSLPAVISSVTLPSAPGPAAPVAVFVTSVTWGWGPSPGATSYNFYPSTGGLPLASATTSVTQTGLAPNTLYGGFATAKDAGGEGPPGISTTVYTLAAAPTAFAMVQVGVGSVLTGWAFNGNPPGTGYFLEVASSPAFAPDISSAVFTSTPAALGSLPPGTTVFLQVRALNAAGLYSPPAPAISTMTLPQPPQPPAGLAGAALGVSSLSWTWSSAPGATGYLFYPSTGGPAIAVATTALTQTGLAINAPYGAAVASVNPGGNSALSATVTTFTGAAPPAAVTLANVGQSTASVGWSFSGNPAGTQYLVEAATSAVFALDVSSAVTGSSPTVLPGLLPGTSYFFQVRAKNGQGFLSPPSPAVSTVTIPAAPPAPLGAALGVSSLTWTWGPVAGATAYNFYPSTGGAPIAVATTSLTQTGLASNTAFSARVSAKDATGEGPLSPPGTSFTLAAAPTSFTLLTVGLSSANFGWAFNGNAGGTPYLLEASTAANFSLDASSAVTPSTPAALGALTPGTAYFFQVRALNAGGSPSLPSAVLSTTTLPGAPIGLTGLGLGVSSMTWNWVPAAGATGYNFYPSTGGPPIPLASPTLNQVGLSTNAAYGARVSAKNATGEGPLTALVTGYTFAAPATNLAFAFVGISSAGFTWGVNTNPAGTSFLLEAALSPSFSVDAASAVFTAGAGTLALTPGTSYYFQVRSRSFVNVLSPPTPALSSTTLANPLSVAPAGLIGTGLGVSSIAWTWTALSSATGYNFYPSTGGPPIPVAATSLVQTGLSTNTAYGGTVAGTTSGGAGPVSSPATGYTLAAVPTGLGAPMVGISSMSLVWSANTNPGGTRYLAEAAVGGNFAADAASAVVTGTAVTLNNLSPSTSYTLQVRALSGAGVLSAAAPLNATTLPNPPSNVPGGLLGTALGVSSITWTWGALPGALGYNFYPSTGGPPIATAATALTQTGLAVNTLYGAQVAAINAGGQGPLTTVALRYTLARTPSGTAFTQVGVSSLTVTWNASANPGGTLYRVDLATGNTIIASQTVPPSSAVFAGLSPATTYLSQVSAVNGDGVASVPDVVVTTQTLPGGPQGLAGAAVDAATLRWSWQAVPGASRYDFYPSTGGPAIAVTAPPFTQGQLAPNAAYGARVSAVSGSGEGPASAPVYAYTAAAPPAGSSATVVWASSATLAWSANGNPPLTGYTLTYGPVGGASFTVNLSSTGILLTGLTEGTTYSASVYAVNAAGLPSAADAAVRFVTGTQIIVTAVTSSGTTISNDFGHGSSSVGIPPGAFANNVTVSVQPPQSFPPATATSVAIQGTNVGLQITVAEGVQPSAPVLLVISYTDADIAGLDPNNLVIARYDPGTGSWITLQSTVDPLSHTVTAYTSHFSLFQVMAITPASTVNDPQAYPNPLRPSKGDAGMTFANLPGGTRIRVYTLAGELVRSLQCGAAGTVVWDGKNDGGRGVASGVYFVLIDKGSGKTVIKVGVER